MSNVGDKIYEVDNQSFTNLANTVNDSSTGLVTRVDQLENNPIYTTAEAYRTDFNYPAGYPIIRNGRLEISNKATSGTYTAADWDVMTRSNGEPIELESGDDSLTIKMVNGVPVLELSDGTATRQFKLKGANGRIEMTNVGGIVDAGDNDALAKKDVAATVNKLSYDQAARRFTQVESPNNTANTGGHMMTYSDTQALYTRKTLATVPTDNSLYVAMLDKDKELKTITTVTENEMLQLAGLSTSETIETRLSSKQGVMEFKGAFNVSSMEAGYKQYQLYSDNNEAQFIIRKNGNDLEVGFDSDDSSAKNMFGEIKLYNSSSGQISGGSWTEDRPFSTIFDGDLSGGVVTLATFTPDNYFFMYIDVTIVKRGALANIAANTSCWRIHIANDNFGGTASDFGIFIQRFR